MNPITISNGHKAATISLWANLGQPRFVVKGGNGGSTQTFRTLEGAKSYAMRYVA